MKTLIKTLTITLSIFLFNTQTTKAQCHIDDWTALKALYESTDGDNWFNRTGWDALIDNQNSPPGNCYLGNLYGISLNGQQRVACIDLDGLDDCNQFPESFGNNLVGNLPTEIGRLTVLKEMHLSNNLLQGTIPSELGDLVFLQELTLNFNFLVGNIPTELGNLNFLINLGLGNNFLTGSIPAELGNLTFLRDLGLHVNNLSGTLPPQLGNLSNLEGFQLNGNDVTGILPDELSNLVNLESLYLPDNNFTGSIPSWLGDLANLEQIRLENNQFTGNLPPELCNLYRLNRLEVSYNNLSGSYPACYEVFCSQLNSPHFNCNEDISDGNNFNMTWEEFCAYSCGKCSNTNGIDGCTDPNACNYNENAICDDGNCLENCPGGVYPGDLNNDGIVNHQDIGISTLYLYNTGPERATEHQNTSWYGHPATDWGIAQYNNKDIKHHDCNGDGEIDENDHQAITDNWGASWSTSPPPPSPPPSDYQVLLQPTDQLLDGFLIMNVSLERIAGGNLTVQGGHFTIDYSDVEGDFTTSTFNLLPSSWLGVEDINLFISEQDFPTDKKIEVGFTKTNNINSNGRGIIGELILEYDYSAAILSGTNDLSYQFNVHSIGVHNGNEFIPIENENLQVNLNSICYSNLIIDEDAPFQNLYQSSNNITTNGFVLIGEKQEVEYNANRVRINSGFSVKAGAEFKVRNNGCD